MLPSILTAPRSLLSREKGLGVGQGPGLQCPEAKGQWGLVSGSLGSTEPLEFAQLQWPWSPGVKAPWELGTDRETLQGSCPKPGSSQASQLPLVAGQAVCLEVGQAPCSASLLLPVGGTCRVSDL